MKNGKESTKITVAMHDKDKTKIQNINNPTKEKLQQLNQLGYGIFETANEFANNRRVTENLSKLHVVYADLDVCKENEDLTVEEREQRKAHLMMMLDSYCPATYYIITKNGIQPVWSIDEHSTDEATIEKYKHIIEGIIEWTKQHGNLGDPVKDVTRLLRKPGYNHMKSEPYMVSRQESSGGIYTLDELKEYFWYESEKRRPDSNISESIENSLYRSINELDIKQVVIDVWKEKGHKAEFDERNGHLFIDGTRTATFKGRQGDKNYIATTSGEYPAKGNAITYTADTLSISNKEAFKWLVNKYGLSDETGDLSVSEDTDFQLLFSDSKTINSGIHALAKHLSSKYSIRTIDGKKDRELYVYQGGVYATGTNIVRQEVERVLETYAKKRYKDEIIDKIKDLTLTDRESFTVDPKFINVQNGIINIETDEFISHSPEHLFTFKLPIIYNPQAECPKILTFLSDILPAEDIKIIQEWLGYCLYRNYFIKKALICVGERDTGKSTLLNVANELIGIDNVSGVSLQKLAKDKFAAASMYQKHVNSHDDLSVSDISDNGEFKMVTGNAYIPAEYKFGDQFMFKNFAKLMFTCNKIPSVADTNDEAYFNRFLIVEFNKSIPPDQVDKQLLSKLTTPEELSGLLNWSLQGLRRLLENESFSYTKGPDEIKTQMLRSGSPIANFAYDCLEEGGNDEWVSKETMYNSFTEYARERKLHIATIIEFGKKLPAYAEYVSSSKKTVLDHDTNNRKQHTGWRNVKIKQGDAELEALLEEVNRSPVETDQELDNKRPDQQNLL